MGAYFNNDVRFGRHSAKTLRIVDAGDGFQIVKGGMENSKGKLIQAEPIAYCETKDEAEYLLNRLCSLEK